MIVHEALGFGHCHLALGVPNWGRFAGIDSLDALRDMGCWTEETPLRVVTGVWGCSGSAEWHKGLLGEGGMAQKQAPLPLAFIVRGLVVVGILPTT